MRLRYQLLLSLLLIANACLRAQQDTVSAYLLTPNHDTLYRKILLCPLFNSSEEEHCFFRQLPAVEGDSVRTYKPEDLLGFGFRFGQKIIHYRRIHYGGRADYFARARVIGKNLNLFADYYRMKPGEVFNEIRVVGVGAEAAELQVYILQDDKGRAIRLTTTRAALRGQLKTFLKERPDLLPLVDEYVGDLRAISFFVQEANKH